MDLFSYASQTDTNRPLAERLRPKSWEHFMGLDRWTEGQKKLLQNIIEKGYLPNLILYGPPGTGKTTFALLLKRVLEDSQFLQVNAVDTGAKKLKELGFAARQSKQNQGQRTVLFIDEIHRLNKAQQDVLLPFSEQADFVLIGATTENPSYELNRALLSRCQTLTFSLLSPRESEKNLVRAAKIYNKSLDEILTKAAQDLLIEYAQGDMRVLLNTFELIMENRANNFHQVLDPEELKKLFLERKMAYDHSGEEHHNCISAFIKSVRGSDPDAAIYYLARMIKGGEDPVFIARRLVVLSSEDVGNADPKALEVAVAGLQAVELVGLPEAGIILAQVTTYLASAPKSNRSYLAWKKALDLVEKTGALPIPLALRSSQTPFSKSLGYGHGYKYSHDGPKSYIEQNFLPEEIRGHKLYEPLDRGFEKKISDYLKWVKE